MAWFRERTAPAAVRARARVSAVALGLAKSGYPALALGYFGQPGLPKCHFPTRLEYFARAVSWLRAQPAGRGRPVVLYGASERAQAALLLASYLPHLASAVVASSPTDIIHDAAGGTGPGWTLGGKPLEIGMPYRPPRTGSGYTPGFSRTRAHSRSFASPARRGKK